MHRTPSPFPLTPPEDYAIEGVLYEYDNDPRVIPQWPESRRMTLVAVVVEDFHTETESEAVGYVITEPAQADELVNFEASYPCAVLFFTIPKRRAKQMCPKLSDDDWKQA